MQRTPDRVVKDPGRFGDYPWAIIAVLESLSHAQLHGSANGTTCADCGCLCLIGEDCPGCAAWRAGMLPRPLT
jgi:hypothetical protein